MIEHKYKKAVDELCEILDANDIPYEVEEWTIESEHIDDGYIVAVPEFDPERRACDVAIHGATYGHEEALFEYYDPWAHSDVVGCLTPEEAAQKMIEKWEANKHARIYRQDEDAGVD